MKPYWHLYEHQILAHTSAHPTHQLQHALFSPILHLCLHEIYCCTTLDRSGQAEAHMCHAKVTNVSHPQILLGSSINKTNAFSREQKKSSFDYRNLWANEGLFLSERSFWNLILIKISSLCRTLSVRPRRSSCPTCKFDKLTIA